MPYWVISLPRKFNAKGPVKTEITNTRESLALLCPEIMFEVKWQRGT
jgi:hypothetical protein